MNVQNSIFVGVLVVAAILSIKVRVPKFGFCIVGTSLDILVILLISAHLTGGIFAINWTMAVFQTLILLLTLMFVEMYRSGYWVDRMIEERRKGEQVAILLTETRAMRIIVWCLKSRRISTCCDSALQEDFRMYLMDYDILDSNKLQEIQKALGGVPLNVPYPYKVREILRQAVRYPWVKEETCYMWYDE